MSATVCFVELNWRGRPVRIEYDWVGSGKVDAPLLVFLHEGLGSLAMWKDFPRQLCQALGTRGLCYSRPGYGRSTPRAVDEHWAPDFMHRQAHEVLPALLQRLGVRQPVWLFGHSDGGSIALLHATCHPVAGVVVLAPHILVEPVSLASITQARIAYERTGLRERLARYHDDVDSAFWDGIASGWIPRSAIGPSRTRSARSPARCSRSRGWTTSTGRWNKYVASPAACPRRACWNSRPADIHPTVISRRR
jgi:pimeloyl-ACP methyl ester carboxylesterase